MFCLYINIKIYIKSDPHGRGPIHRSLTCLILIIKLADTIRIHHNIFVNKPAHFNVCG
jgi:hypothetical protein